MSQKTAKKEKKKEPRYELAGGKKVVTMKLNAIAVLKESALNVAYMCTQLGMHRRSFYRWKEKDPEFARACEEIQEEIYDDAEYRLQKKIHEDKDTASLIFFLKTKCKHRGYIEKQEVEHTTGKRFEVEITTINGESQDQDKVEQETKDSMADTPR